LLCAIYSTLSLAIIPFGKQKPMSAKKLTEIVCRDRPPYEIFIEDVGIVQRVYFEDTAYFIFDIYVSHSKHNRGKASDRKIALYKDGILIKEYQPRITSALATYLALIRNH
jgi:hypothetical protein